MSTPNENLIQIQSYGDYHLRFPRPEDIPVRKVGEIWGKAIEADRRRRETLATIDAAERALLDAQSADELATSIAYEEGRGDEVDPREKTAPAEEALKVAVARREPSRLGVVRLVRTLRESVAENKAAWRKKADKDAELGVMELAGLTRAIEVEYQRFHASFGALELLHGDELPDNLTMDWGGREAVLISQAIELLSEAIGALDTKRRAL